SPYMVNDGRRMVAQVEKPHILLTTYRLTEMEDIRKPMEVLAANNIRSLVIVCDGIEGNALATVIANSVHNPNRETPPFHVVAVTLPISGDERTNFIEDLAVQLGANVFTENKGNKLEN